MSYFLYLAAPFSIKDKRPDDGNLHFTEFSAVLSLEKLALTNAKT
jgi:hypothetical protein